ncbi:unnamed protein product [Brassica oleracea]|uniref:(rape) hypothetical protein n=1 Tax=Brassica napus TaxID=3708 RepID=A0A816RV03_BRANA|nr:unnamed protein product [Brassica napus]
MQAVNDTWLSSDSCKFRCAAVKGVVYGSSIAAHGASSFRISTVSAFSMEYRLVVYVLFVSVWHWRWTLTAKSVALRFSKTSSVG